jgi:arylsulfatase A-like enzyme
MLDGKEKKRFFVPAAKKDGYEYGVYGVGVPRGLCLFQNAVYDMVWASWDRRPDMKRRTFVKTAGISALAAAQAWTQERPHASAPNVLFIMTDQQFAEIMSCRMGRRYLHTPAMDRLAETGMLFTRAYSPNPLCMPARNSIFTGRYPHETGVQSNQWDTLLDPAVFPCMGTFFRNAGYDTGYVGKWHLCYEKKDVNAHGFDYRDVLFNHGHDDEIPAAAISFLNQKREKPFFLTVSFSNPHDMCQLARHQELPSGPIGEPPVMEALPPLLDNAAPPRDEADAMTLIRKAYHNTPMFPVGDYSEEQWRQLRWGYHRLTEKVDALIGQVLDGLRASGQEENTLIVFTSDHGDCCGAHLFNQKTVFYEESARVPFILSYQNKIAHGTSDQLVNTGIDLIATLFDYAGIQQPAGMPGISMRAIAEGRASRESRSYLVVQNEMVQGGEVDGVVPSVRGRMVRSEDSVYCLYDTGKRRESLFDMKNDPGETENLANDPAYERIVKAHRTMLREHAERYHDEKAKSMLAFFA